LQTIKVEANNLTAYATYYYQFSVCGSNNTSPLGRTKTTPAPNDYTSKIGLAVYSCSNFPFGFFNAFGNPARKDSVDYILHVGDYIYEYAGNGDYGYGYSIGRVPKPERVIYTLYDYRERYATYRTDLDLLLSHQQFPWIPVSDNLLGAAHWRSGSDKFNNRFGMITKLQTTRTEMANRNLTTQRRPSSWMAVLLWNNGK
jgi:alkaline phosphatase D